MLELKNITKDYDVAGDKVHALKGVSVNFRKNEFVSILGASGCGKTTLLNITRQIHLRRSRHKRDKHEKL